MPSLKPSLPYGQVPLLEVDGNTICQSMAIARYLASECGIAGSSGLVKAQVDEVVDVINDVQNAMVSFKKLTNQLYPIFFYTHSMGHFLRKMSK